jgi:ubiquinone/menaquinone biosynthesis C-methylase UbiE
MNGISKSELIINLDKLHTTDLGIERIKMNLCLEVEDVVRWCREKISESDSGIIRRGKNWYICTADCQITVNAYSYTIITAHMKPKHKRNDECRLHMQYNADAWDTIAEHTNDGRNKFTSVISHEEYLKAKSGQLKVSLTSVKRVPECWFPKLCGLKILGLASGGGQQGPVFAAHGADVTIFDFSAKQIENERFVAEREGYSICTIKGDMTQPLPFSNASFDFIFNPVSNCYIEKIQPVWDECARVIKPNGILMVGFVKEEHSMFEPDFANEDALISRHRLPFNPMTDLPEEKKREMIEKHEPFVFSHTLTEQLGGMIKAGFILTDIFEDGDGGGLFDKYMNSYVAVRAIKAQK